MKIVLSILIWIIIILLLIWGVKSAISLFKEIKAKKLKKMNNVETTNNEELEKENNDKEIEKGE